MLFLMATENNSYLYPSNLIRAIIFFLLLETIKYVISQSNLQREPPNKFRPATLNIP